jgi:hypothetical protein
MSVDWRRTLWTLLATFCIAIIRCTETFWLLCISLPITSLIKSSLLYFISIYCLVTNSLFCKSKRAKTVLFKASSALTLTVQLTITGCFTNRLFIWWPGQSYKLSTQWAGNGFAKRTFKRVELGVTTPNWCRKNGTAEIQFTSYLNLLFNNLHVPKCNFYEIPYHAYWDGMEIVYNINIVLF